MFFFIINSIFISILFGQYNTNIIVLPFRSNIHNNNKDDISKFIYSKELFTEILIGTPPQCLNLNFNSEIFIFYLSPNVCYDNSPSFYNYSKSSTFHLITFGFEEDRCDEFSEGAYVSDYVSFYNAIDLKTNITKSKIEFYYTPYITYKKIDKVCGNIGLGLKQKFTDYNIDTFLGELKKRGLINAYSWTYKYFEKNNNKILNIPDINNQYIIDNFEGVIILGNYPEIDKKSDENNNYISTLAVEREKNLKWDIIFSQIFINDKGTNIIDKDIHAYLSINYDYIVSPKEYFDKLILSFFSSYIDNKKCNIKELKHGVYDYEIIVCDKDLFTIKDIKQFPTIYFYHNEFNYTFELNYKDLFEEINNNIYFLILRNIGNFNAGIWKMGKIFLKKYQFSFNQDSKMIYFFTKFENNKLGIGEDHQNINNKVKTKFNNSYIWIAVCIICLIIGIYIGNKIIVKNRKMRANELEDKYEYKSEKVNNNIKINLINEQNIEMGTKGLGI